MPAPFVPCPFATERWGGCTPSQAWRPGQLDLTALAAALAAPAQAAPVFADPVNVPVPDLPARGFPRGGGNEPVRSYAVIDADSAEITYTVQPVTRMEKAQ